MTNGSNMSQRLVEACIEFERKESKKDNISIYNRQLNHRASVQQTTGCLNYRGLWQLQ